ncbi:MAG: transcriptional regulator [Gammaproteobacteria bacterium HGW-Gammaproteobacteria-4]|jgi:putative FmdB family regulatory protein|nr:MAG: transcriptional regulator [Gammaproteobacteria bacterium HGW-Gammaproteobacteria-4]
MPIYAFACNSCGHAFERLQKLSDADPDACPACAEQTVQRQLTAPQFRLSGSGWYETDFKKEGETKRNLVDKGEGAAAAAAPSDSKGEVKGTSPATASVTKAESKPMSSSNDSA